MLLKQIVKLGFHILSYGKNENHLIHILYELIGGKRDHYLDTKNAKPDEVRSLFIADVT